MESIGPALRAISSAIDAIVSNVASWFVGLKAEQVTAAANVALAFLTLILALGTLFLWRATRHLVKESERTAKQQLRAYVFIRDGWIESDGRDWGFTIILKNFGQTPAYGYSTWVGGEIFPTDSLPFPEPTPLSKRVNRSIVAPSAETPIISQPVKLIDNELQDTRSEKKAFFVWGGVDYVDVFGQSHSFVFKTRTSGPAGRQNDEGRSVWPLKPHPLGYDEN
jgi:hypothetical protein